MKDFQDKVAAVTGAGSGIGRALALQLAAEGARVAISDWDAAGLAETAALLDARGTTAHCTVLDVRDRAAVHAWADAVAAHFGTVNLVVNNAGITIFGTVEESPYEDIEKVVDVDFWGVVHGTKAFLPHLVASGDGHVVNVSSIFGLFGVPTQSSYNAAKFAVRGFTEALRQEMLLAGHPVGVTCVHPGGIRTNIVNNATASNAADTSSIARTFNEKLTRTSPEDAARTILRGVRRRRPKVLIGADAVAVDLVVRVLGAAYQRPFAAVSRRLTTSLAAPTTTKKKVSA
ncbi:SDR family NAD(P)-dependent oxidoreductase [Pimelobacter simplex]|uniref:Short chain dehydrogenase n=1 Tax=Nocardioides simplex TaxID=2045 RepID=A0A0C5XHA7_NOCSI|nr:SDR family NAD(P)-dependent oxidoreductase [Pimelobacter simplex]AJR18521.1 short chain dehydrogenase [Pimelobacter simplex]MCG8152586.1 SDR family NAD(P)-dependent oxidoreductase [Pimelobacter simplex]GEB17035.1 short-chain type dehydrogenase/reductase [Pimelobacter simplex]SFM76537.1 NADP-dependent 3-hydroxy acid dehydrogenase YdfG [Pimelobacter simplex]